MCEISAKNIWTALNRLGGIIGFKAAATIQRQAILYPETLFARISHSKYPTHRESLGRTDFGNYNLPASCKTP